MGSRDVDHGSPFEDSVLSFVLLYKSFLVFSVLLSLVVSFYRDDSFSYLLKSIVMTDDKEL